MDNLEYLMVIIWSIYIYISLKIYKRARRCACAMSATSALEQLPPSPQRGNTSIFFTSISPNPQRGLNLQYLTGDSRSESSRVYSHNILSASPIPVLFILGACAARRFARAPRRFHKSNIPLYFFFKIL